MITGIGIALGQQPVSACSAFDATTAARSSIGELIGGVNALLQGCA